MSRRWKRIIAVAISSSVLLVVTAVVAIILSLHYYPVRQYFLRIALRKVDEAVGVPVEIQDFELHLSGFDPSVDLYGVTIDSAAPYTNTPLLQAEHLAVGLRIVSILHRKWYLADVRIDHPVARIFIDDKGNNNLPKGGANSNSKTDIFDLGIRHTILDHGEIYYNDRKSALDADLHDLNLQARFDPALQQYSGALSYHDGSIRTTGFTPFVHSLDTQFDATSTGLNLKHVLLRSGSSEVVLSATLQNYAQPSIQAHYEATLNGAEIRQFTKIDTLPAGTIRLTGTVRYAATPNRTLLDTINVQGSIVSDSLHVALPSLKTDVHDFSARYQLQNGNIDVRDVRAGVLGGEITGSLAVADVAGAARSQAQANVRNISLAALRTLAGSPGTAQIRIAGALNANVRANWTKTLDTLVARTDAVVQANVTPGPSMQAAAAQTTVPLNGSIHAQYRAADQQISLQQSQFQTPQTILTANGTISKTSALQVRFECGDLQELETIADEFGFSEPAQPLGLSGTATFSGSFSGSLTNPQIAGLLSANALRMRKTSWKSLTAKVTASPSRVTLENGDLRPTQRGNIAFNIGVDLNRWAFANTNPIQIDLNATQLDVEELAKLADFKTPVSGTLSTNVSVRGSELSPTGQGTANLTQAIVEGESIQSVNVAFQGTPDELRGRLTLQMPAGTAQATVTYFPKQQTYNGQLSANGIRLDRIQILTARNAQIGGVLNLTASGTGSIKDPELKLSARIPQLKLRDQTVSGVTVQVNISKHIATVSLDSQMLNIALHGNGTIDLSGDYNADAKLDTMAIPLEPLIALYAPSQAGNITGETEIHGTLHGPLKHPAAIDAHITIPTLSINYKDTVKVGATAPIQADFTKGVLTIQKTAIHGTGTDLQIQGTIPTNGAAPISLLLIGTIDLQLAQLINPDLISSGQIQFNINSLGKAATSDVQGQIRIVNANIAAAGSPVGIQNANGTLRLTNDRLEIQDFRSTVGGGTLTATGGVTYKPSIQFNIVTAGTDIRLLYPDTVREELRTNLLLTGSTNSAQLRGQVYLEQVSFTPDFDLADFAGQLSESSTPVSTGFARNLQLNIGVQSTNDINLVNSKLSVQGSANLRVTGTAAEPIVLGRVSLNSGDLIFMGNRYLLQPSTLDFVNPAQIQPVVNVAADTTVSQYNLHLRFRGTIDHLRTDYSSDPSLAPADIINLLVFGKTIEAGAANSTLGDLGAESLIASSVSGKLTDRVEQVVGISQLSVDPVLGGNQQNPGALVTIQQRVTSDLFVTFATDVTSTNNAIVKVEYQATPRLSISAVRDQNGGFALDLRLRKIW